MLPKDFKQKLKKFLYGEDSKEGKAMFDRWYHSFDASDDPEIGLSDEEDRKRRLSAIYSGILQKEQKSLTLAPVKKDNKIWLAVAASLAILLTSGITFWVITNSSKIIVETGYGEIKTITLPDHSSVTLNANSTLTYNKDWEAGKSREVWLEGEALFDVVKKSSNERFHVFSANMMVEVLGTIFSVSEREDNYRVVLKSGKVTLNHLENKEVKPVTLQPGEIVSFKKETRTFEKKSVNTDVYTSWSARKFIFEETTIGEVTEILTHNYGMQVSVANPRLLEKKISGSIPTDNLDNLLFSLSELFNLEIKKDGDQIFIKEK